MHINKRFKNLILLGMVILIYLGVYFRFSNLENKAYWGDEAYTSLWISGYSREAVKTSIPETKIISFKDIQKYHGELEERKGISATVNRLATEDAQHPPLYYVFNYIWTQLKGTSIASYRSFSAFIGILILLATYFLGLQVFESQASAMIFVSIVAISPFHLIWSQEAREYNLWILVIMCSSALFLRCLKFPNKIWLWVTYALSLTLGLYTHVFMSLIIGVHLIYFLSKKSIRSSRKRLLPFMLCLLLGYLLFLPWAVNLFNVGFDAAGWTSKSLTSLTYSKIFVLNIVRTFFDFDFEPGNLLSYLGILILVIVIYSAINLAQNLRKNNYLFIFYLCIVPIVPFLLADMIMGGQRALVSRYFVSSYIGLELMVAATIVDKLRFRLSILITACIIGLGLLSCYYFNQSDFWWNKNFYNDNLPIAQIINQHRNPLLIIDNNMSLAEVLSISYNVRPSTLLMRTSDSLTLSKIICSQNDIFLLNVSDSLVSQLNDEGYEVFSEFKEKQKLWKISCNLN
jgi:uncharacterized membrane protein